MAYSTAPKAAYSVAEVQAISGLGRDSLYKAINSGELRAKKFGRRTLITHADLIAWLDNLPLLTAA